jgi:hypothetical protein
MAPADALAARRGVGLVNRLPRRKIFKSLGDVHLAELALPIEVTAIPDQEPDTGPLPIGERFKLLLAAGLVLLLLEFAAPWAGLLGLPITFFLKNKLHLSAQALATFNLRASAPLYISFLFGFLRDRWSPFGAGDRGYLIGFGLITAALFTGLAFIQPSYLVLLGGVILVSTGGLIAGSAARGMTSAIGQKNAITGQAGTIVNLATLMPGVVAYALGGFFSQALEGQGAVIAARILFLVGAGLMAMVALFGVFGPRGLLETHHGDGAHRQFTFLADVRRLASHWPIYPVLIIYGLWQFAPAGGAALQYHLANTLHATDGQVGLWYAMFSLGFIPVVAAYGWLCQKVKLSTLLWAGTLLAVPQFVPFLFIHNVNQALVAGVIMGVMGGLGQAAYVDLAIRACPKGLQGTMMMLLITMYWIPYRFGDLWGTYLYDKQGGFRAAIIATICVYALILPMLLLVPKRLTNSVDGQAEPAGA